MVRKKRKNKIKIDVDLDDCKKMKCMPKMYGGKCGGGYFLGFLGAVIYYISTATGFWVGVLGILKAMVWPVFLVYEVLKFLGA